MAVLYVTATPIGNLKDITLRALDVMKATSVFACEDTRHTLNLIRAYDLGDKKLISYHEHNKRAGGERVLAELTAGHDVVLVSDAGMPGVSDPGEQIVRETLDAGFDVTVLPGASASLTALVLSGLPTGRFAFEGFLPDNKKERAERIRAVMSRTETGILYAAPHDLRRVLEELSQADGSRRVAVCHELTKIHECVYRYTLDEALSWFSSHEPRGEYVLILEGMPEPRENGTASLPRAEELIDKLLAAGLSPADTAKAVSLTLNRKKSEIYSLTQSRKK
ncbi:MAG: 16S rRNA (cytidine(1402)-2'-O)-methyltransferase [Eubacteriales bacterium]|nr:16S rRNA (cytidine(1402)-2'-O)-methyltransferase [Eubacteriales bacterium]